MNLTDAVIYLAKCAVNEIVPDKEIVETLDLDAVYQEASRHMVTAMVGISLLSAGVSNLSFKQAIAMAQRKTVIQNYELNKLFTELEKAGIWHMALKGAILKDWYPRFGMRESADVDVLFDSSRASDVRNIMISLGFSVVRYGERHHDVYHKMPLSNFEMHRDLMDESCEKRLYDYYGNIEDKLIQEGYERYFKPEDFYLYFLAHEYKHYNLAGTGLRSVVDTHVILRHFPDLDCDYIKTELVRMGISEFEEKNRSLATHLFDGRFAGELSEDDVEMLHYIIGSGVYGTFENRINNYVERHGNGLLGKARYLLYRTFLPMPTIKRVFPIFYKYKILLPFLPMYRVIRSFGGDRFNKEISILNSKKKSRNNSKKKAET